MTPARSCTTVLDVLRACEEWFDGHPERWCRHSYAIDSHGRRTSYAGESDKARCVVGEVRFSSGANADVANEALDALWLTLPKIMRRQFYGLPSWQDDDDRTHADIVAAFRAAREREERR